MKKINKRILSLLLSLLMIVSVMPVGAITAQAANLVYPVAGNHWINQKYQYGVHDGIDIGANVGTNIVAAMSGTVIVKYTCTSQHYGSNGDCWGFGTGLVIRGDDNRTYQYCHLQGNSIPSNVYVNARVKAGQVIGKIGTTGNSSGIHLHFGITNNWNYWEDSGVNPERENYSVPNPPAPKISSQSATGVRNEDATINIQTANGNFSSWGAYLSTSKSKVENKANDAKYTASNSNSNKGSVSASALLKETLAAGTTYYYRTWAQLSNGTNYGSVSSFTTTKNAPAAPTVSIASDNHDLGIGDSPTVNWKSGNDANSSDTKTKKFVATLYDSTGTIVQEKSDIAHNATSYTFEPITKAGKYTIQLKAINNAGETMGAPTVEIEVHPDVTVTFKDALPNSFVDYQQGDSNVAKVLDTKVIHYGKSAELAANPTHNGYTFVGWDGDSKNVKEDTILTAKYEINKYTVKFVSEKGEKLKEQEVEYYSSATAPTYDPKETGYIFTQWDKDFSHVDSNMTVTAVIDWYNKNYSVFTTITGAVRDEDNNGYDISVSLKNNAEKLTTGRIIYVLKTSENKMLVSSESSAFSIKANATKNFDVFIPYENAAAKVYVYVVDSYKSMTPISEEKSSVIDMGLAWTSWSTDIPEEGTYDKLEQRTEYRYKTREITTSYSTSLPGYTQNGFTPIKSDSGYIDYVQSWPSGFNKSHGLFGQYNKSPKTNSETATLVTTVPQPSTIGYLYWHWSYPLSGYHAEDDRVITDTPNERTKYGVHSIFEAFYKSGSPLGWNYNKGAFECRNHSTYSYWWFATTYNSANQLPVKRSEWTTYNKLYNYYKISDWCEWQTDTLSSYEAKEERVVYRYKPKDNNVEDTSGNALTISGSLDKKYAGKQVTLYIFKVDEASDYSNEYIGQTVLDSNGTYTFNFKLREEPTVSTGDFTAALGLEGATSLIYLDDIDELKAPEKTYTVKFVDFDDKLISTQTVVEGGTAVLPDKSKYNKREGYTFTNWSVSNANITRDTTIKAEYKINTYTVVFVDWEARSVQIREFEHGAELTAPALEAPENGIVVSWDKIDEGVETVTENMVVCTVYKEKIFNVEFKESKEADANIISEESIAYGYIPTIPDIEDDDVKMFIGWESTESGEIVDDLVATTNISVCPKFIFNETCSIPTASIDSGEYTTAQTITLSSDDEHAVIWYTLDGSDPTQGNAIEYTAPIKVTSYATLKFYATSLGKNDSAVETKNYVINTSSTPSASKHHIVTIEYFVNDYPLHETGTQKIVTNNSLISQSDLLTLEGYTLSKLYKDAEHKTQWNMSSNKVTSSVTLYAEYTPNTYTVKFVNYNGSVLSTQTVEYCGEATPPDRDTEVPILGRYVLIDWDSQDYKCVKKDLTIKMIAVPLDEYATVEFADKKLNVTAGSQIQLYADLKPELSKTLIYEVDNEELATVDDRGVLTALKGGTVTVKVTVSDSKKSDTCTVIIASNPSIQLVLKDNDKCKVDSEGFIRSLAVKSTSDKSTTVAELSKCFENPASNLVFKSAEGTVLSSNDIVATGATVSLVANNNVIDTMTFVMTGDVDGDGVISNKDVGAINRFVVNMKTLEHYQAVAADVNGDGSAGGKDASMIARYLVGKAEL